MKISIDTRTLQAGDIFIPIKGPNYDGHQFIDIAIKKGAQKILDVDIAKYATSYRKKLSCPVIGITGSAGKTTIKDMLTSILSQKYKVSSSKENLNNQIGVPLSILRADSDTELLILEMAMRNKGEIAYLTKIARPTHIIITNIGLTHIANLKTQRNIALAKSEIMQKSLQWESQRIAFLNSKTPYYNLLKEKALKNQFKIFPFEGETKLEQNLDLCYKLAKHFNLTEHQIQQGLNNIKLSKQRQNIIKLKDITLIDDTYNANPDGVKYALEQLRQFQGRKIFVFGDMLELGKFSKKEHNKIPNLALDAGVSLIYTFGEHATKISSSKIACYPFQSKKQLTQMLIAEIKKGDTILFKGSRSMKIEEIVKEIINVYS